MSTDHNKRVVREGVNDEMISGNRLDLVNEIFAESFVNHTPSPGQAATAKASGCSSAPFRAPFPGSG